MKNTINEQVMEQAKKSRAEYYRNWRKRNPEKTKQYNMNYWVRKAEQLMSGQAEKEI